MKKSFQLSAVAIAIAASSSVMADSVNVLSFDDVYGWTPTTSFDTDAFNTVTANTVTANNQLLVNGDATVNGTLKVNGEASNVLSSEPVATGANLIIPTVDPALANTTQNFSQDRVDTQDQTRSVDLQVIDTNKFQLRTSEQVGKQTWTTSQTATAEYDAAGVIVPGSLTGPVLGVTIDNDFEADSVDKIQDLTLGRDNEWEDYRLSISKTENGVTNTTTVNASGISTNQITLAGQDLATTIANGDAATLAAANTYTDTQVANEAATRAAADTTLQNNIDAEAATRAAADTALQNNIDAEAATRAAADTTLQNNIDAEAATRAAADTTLQNNIDAEAATRAAADATLQNNIDAEAATRAAGDQAIRDDITTKVTTNELEVNGPSTFNGPVTVNNVKAMTTVDQAGTPATTPEFGADVDGDGRPDTLIQKKEQTDTVTVQSQTQAYNENNLTFSSKTEKGTLTTVNQYTADIIYDQNGVATYGPNAENAQIVTPDLQTVAEDSIIVGKETANSETALTVRSKDANGESATVVTSKSVSTGNVAAKTITLDGKDLAATISEGDAATLASAKGYTDTTATTLRSEAATETVRVNKAIVDGDAATLTSAKGYTDTKAAATLTSANTYTNTKAAETLTSANAYTDGRANQLNRRVDDVEKTSYRGIAIALAAQQAIPSIQPGQVAVFGGVGHYEGETAGAVGVVGALNDRTSLSAALGFAGGNEVGGRVGVAYVFGGK